MSPQHGDVTLFSLTELSYGGSRLSATERSHS